MALTQTATIPGPGPSWDEEVVPALRKRLESESRTISRRLSAISMSSNEEIHNGTMYREPSAIQSFQNSATPLSRPVQQSRQNSERSIHSARVNGTNSGRPSSRSRTQSSASPIINGPYSKQNVTTYSSGETYSNSRPTSPNSILKPSRIPQPSRTRTASLSSNHYAPFPNGRASPYTPPTTVPDMHVNDDLWKLNETSSQSTISVTISKQRSGILNEQPPFNPGSTSSSSKNRSDESLYDDKPRPSVDSEERPFEHWYRGDISRNGGVGELRVAKRQEMMDIANYGHSLKNSNPATRNAITDAIDNRKRRKRADSVGDMMNRTSFYMDEEKAEEVARVLDENPLTDVDDASSGRDDDDDDFDEAMDVDMSTSSAPLPTMAHGTRSITPTPDNYSKQNSHSRIPGPRTTTPTPSSYQRGTSEPPPFPSSSTSKNKQQQAQLRSTSASPNATPNGKRGASPGVASSSSAKKSRLNAGKATQAKLAKQREMEQEARKSVAAYPAPAEDDLAHAIPTWSEPVPRQGNWDDVVLPAVAKKRGLDGYYEQADGSPKPRQVDKRPEPAPGTFGYDHSRYRPPREDQDIPMDEFGQPIQEEDEKAIPGPTNNTQLPTDTSSYHSQGTRSPTQPRLPPSPVPFSSYGPDIIMVNGRSMQTKPMDMDVEANAQQPQQMQLEEEKDAGGCCKCVIM